MNILTGPYFVTSLDVTTNRLYYKDGIPLLAYKVEISVWVNILS